MGLESQTKHFAVLLLARMPTEAVRIAMLMAIRVPAVNLASAVEP
jgi:hypothetical protein